MFDFRHFIRALAEWGGGGINKLELIFRHAIKDFASRYPLFDKGLLTHANWGKHHVVIAYSRQGTNENFYFSEKMQLNPIPAFLLPREFNDIVINIFW